jgi:hypothetical protein
MADPAEKPLISRSERANRTDNLVARALLELLEESVSAAPLARSLGSCDAAGFGG